MPCIIEFNFYFASHILTTNLDARLSDRRLPQLVDVRKRLAAL